VRTNTLLWIVQGLLAALFLFAGSVKLILPLQAMTMPVPLPGLFISSGARTDVAHIFARTSIQ
jgi:hypothetical protein